MYAKIIFGESGPSSVPKAQVEWCNGTTKTLTLSNKEVKTYKPVDEIFLEKWSRVLSLVFTGGTQSANV